MEMGFPRDQVMSALSSCGWNEENAINILLGVDSNPPAPQQQQQQPPPFSGQQPQQISSQKSKTGGYFWGKK
jgi:hypothetical protein